MRHANRGIGPKSWRCSASMACDRSCTRPSRGVSRGGGRAGLERNGTIGLLRSVDISADAGRRGVGSALVRQVLRDARVKLVREVYLLTTMASDWFPRFGFSVVPRSSFPAMLENSEELRGACPGTAVAMKAVAFSGGSASIHEGLTILRAGLHAPRAAELATDAPAMQPASRVTLSPVSAGAWPLHDGD